MQIHHQSNYELDEKVNDLLTQAIDNHDKLSILKIISETNIDSIQLAYFLLTSTYDHRENLIKLIDTNLPPETLIHVIPDIRKEIIKILGIKKTVLLIKPLDCESIVTIIKDLDKKISLQIFNALPRNVKNFVSELLSYPEDSAGRLIHKDIIIVPEYWNVGQLLDFLQNYNKKNKNFHQVFVVNPKLEPIGYLALNNVLCSKRDQQIKKIMRSDLKIIKPGIDQEEVANIFYKYSLLSAPVVNKEGRIIGAILVNDIVQVIHTEVEEDILHLGRVSQTDISSSLWLTVLKRLPWLMINLLTATLASIVIGFFKDTLHHFIELSVIMPVIASMSGNAGLQALTITIRAISTKQLTKRNMKRLLIKESLVGFSNGIILASISAIVIMFRFHDPKIEILFSISMIITFTLATLIGAAVPITLNALKADPAVSSSIIICASSDMLSFSIFLGLATIFLMG